MEHLLRNSQTFNTTSRSYVHGVGAIPLTGETIPERFARVAQLFPEQEAVVSIAQNVRVTYAQLQQAIDQVARGLLAMGFARGDKIAIWSTNNLEWLLVQFATARIGAILVNINPAYRPRELQFTLQKSGVHALVTTPGFEKNDYIATLAELIPQLQAPASAELHSERFPTLRRVIVVKPDAPESPFRPLPGFTTWQELTKAATDTSQADIDRITHSLDPDDPINIQFTSGTTGSPKAVVLTHHNVLNNAISSAHLMGFTDADRLCVPVPFYHCFGMVLANLMTLSVGGCIVIPSDSFSAELVLQAIQDERCTAVHGVPTMFIAELDALQDRDFDLSRLRTGIMAGASCPPQLVKRVMTELHCPDILIGYGQTEASPVTNLTRATDTVQQRIETVGQVLPHQEIKIVDLESGATLDRNQTGEICFRGYHVMRGYYQDPEATSATIDENGWLHSGDLGVIDHDGYLQITGRLKEMIIRGGENIYPREIEDYLYTHPAIAEVAVFGLPDETYGEVVMAWVQLRPGEQLTAEDIKMFCRGNIAHFKIPKYIEFVDSFPMTVTGKFQKFRMRELAIQHLEGSAV